MNLPAQEFRDAPVPKPEGPKPELPHEMREVLEGERLPSVREEMERRSDPETPSDRMQREVMDRLRMELVPHSPDKAGLPEFRPSPWLIGISILPLEGFVRAHLGLEKGVGARVSLVAENTPAAEAGIVVDDIVISADGQKISGLEELKTAVEKSGKEGRPVSLEILHQGQRKTLSIVPRGPKPEPEVKPQAQEPERRQNNLARRLNRQEKLVKELRQEIAELRKKVERLERDDEQE
ncbi:PDZ domain-containing protein [Luteolibacter sp. GHJ8]|uniref:PDZ domain-containing protein n=2 Tax=Luteolibacter rhizosphaerae TaxID=2989719 RepID=A0ABT3G7T3_9BACT|nr:PDZ domain-containing protein [Luteolibacter rhizosphaerae]